MPCTRTAGCAASWAAKRTPFSGKETSTVRAASTGTVRVSGRPSTPVRSGSVTRSEPPTPQRLSIPRSSEPAVKSAPLSASVSGSAADAVNE